MEGEKSTLQKDLNNQQNDITLLKQEMVGIQAKIKNNRVQITSVFDASKVDMVDLPLNQEDQSDMESVYSIEEDRVSVDSNRQYKSIKSKRSKHVDINKVNLDNLPEDLLMVTSTDIDTKMEEFNRIINKFNEEIKA